MKKSYLNKYLLAGLSIVLFSMPLFVSCNDDDDDYVVIPADIVGRWTVESWGGWYQYNDNPKSPIVVPDIAENYFIAFNADSTYTTDTTLVGPIMGNGKYLISSNNRYLYLFDSNYPDDAITYEIEELIFRKLVISQSVDTTYTVDSVVHNLKTYEKIELGSLD